MELTGVIKMRGLGNYALFLIGFLMVSVLISPVTAWMETNLYFRNGA